MLAEHLAAAPALSEAGSVGVEDVHGNPAGRMTLEAADEFVKEAGHEMPSICCAEASPDRPDLLN